MFTHFRLSRAPLSLSLTRFAITAADRPLFPSGTSAFHSDLWQGRKIAGQGAMSCYLLGTRNRHWYNRAELVSTFLLESIVSDLLFPDFRQRQMQMKFQH